MAPIEDDRGHLNFSNKKYETYTCPHCKTKNVIREGQTISEARCIKCKKKPASKSKGSLPIGNLLVVGFVLLILLLAYRVFAPGLLDSQGAGMVPAAPEPSGMVMHPMSHDKPKNKDGSGQPERQLDGASPKTPVAPEFAVDACASKSFHDYCVSQAPEGKRIGVCERVRGVLVCIPND